MADRVELAFRGAAERLIPERSSVLVAVSGGGDSVALLHLIAEKFPGGAPRIVVAHLDHGLRRGSTVDRRFVLRLARDLGLPCVAERQAVETLRRRDESLEEAARRIRRGFLLRAAQQSGSDRIATGHTLDDQAETVLMRLVRGAGATALCGIAENGPGPFVRPLLGIERADLRRYLERKNLAFRDDPSNLDPRFDRNRVRLQILPALAESLNPRAARHLVQAAERLREDALYLDTLAEEEFRRHARKDREGRVTVSVDALGPSFPPIAKRVARLALRHAGADPRRITARHIEALVDLARGGERRSAHLPGELVARRGPSDVTIGSGDGGRVPADGRGRRRPRPGST